MTLGQSSTPVRPKSWSNFNARLHYGGYDGFLEDSVYYMRQTFNGESYASKQEMEFTSRNLVDPSGATAIWISDALRKYAGFNMT